MHKSDGKFSPGMLVKLNADALTENVLRCGRLFPDLTERSILRVLEQKGRAVYIDTQSQYHSVLNEMWLRPANDQEIQDDAV